jgi:predicted dehydrogenase
MRQALIAIAIFGLMACDNTEQRAKAAAHAAIKRDDDRAAELKKEFSANRELIITRLKTLVASKDWDAASIEASKWRHMGDPDIAMLEKSG